MNYFDIMTVDELKTFLIEKNIDFNPYSKNEVDKKKEELGGMPKILEEYYLKIGWFDDIECAGMGNMIYPLEDIGIVKSEDLVQEYGAENEVDDYLEIGGEAVSVDTFAIKIKDFDLDNPFLYGFGDSYYEAEELGLCYCIRDEWETVQNFFALIANGVNDIA